MESGYSVPAEVTEGETEITRWPAFKEVLR